MMNYILVAWGQTCKSNIDLLQRQSNICLRYTLNAPGYIRNTTIFRILRHTPFKEKLGQRARKAFTLLESHSNLYLREPLAYDHRTLESYRNRGTNCYMTRSKKKMTIARFILVCYRYMKHKEKEEDERWKIENNWT